MTNLNTTTTTRTNDKDTICMALNVLFALGVDTLQKALPEVHENTRGTSLSKEARERIVEIASMLAGADNDTLVELICFALSKQSSTKCAA